MMANNDDLLKTVKALVEATRVASNCERQKAEKVARQRAALRVVDFDIKRFAAGQIEAAEKNVRNA